MIYRAIVADVRDPAQRNRIKVVIPAITGQSVSEWIWPLVTGDYVALPGPGDQVWVAFENGDMDAPVWLGKTATDRTAITTTENTYFSPSRSNGGGIVTTTHNGSTVTVLLPADGAVNFPAGTQITFIQRGTSQISFTADSGVTLEATPGLKTRTQYSAVTASKVASNVWAVYGDLTT